MHLRNTISDAPCQHTDIAHTGEKLAVRGALPLIACVEVIDMFGMNRKAMHFHSTSPDAACQQMTPEGTHL